VGVAPTMFQKKNYTPYNLFILRMYNEAFVATDDDVQKHLHIVQKKERESDYKTTLAFYRQ
jgi:hypothetical protein